MIRKLIVGAVIAAAAAGVGTLYANSDAIGDAVITTAAAHGIGHIEEDQPGWDCHTMGNRVCGPSYDLQHEDTGDTACWVEKVHSAATAEVICGDRGKRPATDTADIGEVFATGDHCGWVASGPLRDGYTIEPAGCN